MNLRDYLFSLPPLDFGQMMDGLSARREAWDLTARWFRGENPDPFFQIEECKDEHEARGIADHYEAIMETLQEQVSWQRNREYPSPELPAAGSTGPAWCLHPAGGPMQAPGDQGKDFTLHSTERDARETLARERIDRCREYLAGSRDWESLDSGFTIAPVTLHPDGSITGGHGGNPP